MSILRLIQPCSCIDVANDKLHRTLILKLSHYSGGDHLKINSIPLCHHLLRHTPRATSPSP
ncbi:MAG: hypothetical protein PUP92_37995 [Rhizonema sp. PD38]|nr:hypothetical protein [Rhizonema sp. PD38]